MDSWCYAKEWRMRFNKSSLGLLILCLALPLASGCGLASKMVYFFQGQQIPAKYAGLKDKKVAVVCITSSNSGGPGTEADVLARSVSKILTKEVPGIDVVPQDKVIDWMDKNNWNQIDYKQVGRGVKADTVVAIELGAFTIHEGQTLLRGRAGIGVKVFDMTQKGKLVYDTPAREISFPKNGASQVTQSELEFRRLFVWSLAQEIARDFHSYDAVEDLARDSAFY
jgi:hypothetical protein